MPAVLTLAALLLQAGQPAQRVDPLHQRMQRFCRSRPACLAKQQRGVRGFLDIITRKRLPRPVIQRCLDKASRRSLTDWSAAEACLRRASGRR